MKCPPHSSKSAFTLIEMLVVIAIIALLMAIIIPSINSALARSKATACASNLRQIGNAFKLYSLENEGKIPYQLNPTGTGLTTWHVEIAPYLEGYDNGDYYNVGQADGQPLGVYNCLTGESPTRSGNYADYGMNYLVKDDPRDQEAPQRRLYNIPTPSKVLLLGDSVNATRRLSPYSNNGALDPRHPGEKVNILYVDGHVDSHTVAEIHGNIQGNRTTQTPWGWEGWRY